MRSSETAAKHDAVERNRNAAPLTRYVVDRYPDGDLAPDQWAFGVRREYQHADRPELGWINGGFVWVGISR